MQHRILLIGHHLWLLEQMTTLLEHHHFDVVSCDGDDALDFFLEMPFDAVVFSDNIDSKLKNQLIFRMTGARPEIVIIEHHSGPFGLIPLLKNSLNS